MRKISCIFQQLLFQCLFATGAATCLAQGMYVSEPITIRNDFGYELIGRLHDRILLFRDKYDAFEVQAFDNQLHVAWNKEINDIGKHNVQVLSVIGGKNDFSVIYKIKKKGHTLLRVNKYDPGASLIDSMTLKDYGDRVFNPPALEIVKSENKNCYMVYDNSDREKQDAICFRLDKMQVVWSKNLEIPHDFSDEGIKGMVLNDGGDLYIFSEFNNRRSKLESHEYRIQRVNAQDNVELKIPMHDFMTGDAKFSFNNQRHELIAGGLYAEKARDRVNGCFFLAVKQDLDSTYLIHFEPFDAKFISILRGKDVEDDTKGITEAEVRQLILRQDGGLILIGERSHEVQRGSAAGRGFWREGVRMIIDYYYDDIFAIAMHRDGQTHWKTVLHKKQYSEDDEGTFSSFFIARSQDKLHFLFNDEIKYENTCSQYLVSPVGRFDRNSLLNTVGQGLRLRFRDALQISSGECLIPSEFRNRLKLVLVRF
jgi:hypothetical protein